MITRPVAVLSPSPVGLYYTYKTKTSHFQARCKAKYCRPCLKNRYGQDLDEIKARGIDLLSKEAVGHDKAQDYIFKYAKLVVPYLSLSHRLSLLYVHDALASAIVVGVVKPWVLSPLGTLQTFSGVLVSCLFFDSRKSDARQRSSMIFSRPSCLYAPRPSRHRMLY